MKKFCTLFGRAEQMYYIFEMILQKLLCIVSGRFLWWNEL